MKSSVFLAGALLAATTASPSAARDLGFIANAWQVFMTECAGILRDPGAYVQRLPPSNPDGSLTRTVSEDGKVVRLSVQIGNGFFEASINTLSDREERACTYFEDFAPEWDTATMAQQLTGWLGQSPGVEIVGGAAPIHGYPHVEHVVLGLWPSYDMTVLSVIHENEYQLSAAHSVR